MTLSADVARILDAIEGVSGPGRGTVSEAVASGVEQSGIIQAIAGVSADNQASMTALAAAVGVATDRIVGEIRLSNLYLSSISEMLASPLDTAASERFRRGVHAFERGWIEESQTEFAAAVESNPYIPQHHLMHGLSSIAADDNNFAVDCLRKAARYGMPDQPDLAAGAALLAVSLLEQLNRLDDARDEAQLAQRTHPTVPEVQLLHARLFCDRESAGLAVSLAPELALVADSLPLGFTATEAIQSAKLQDPIGVSQRIRNASEAYFAEQSTMQSPVWRFRLDSGGGDRWLAAAETFRFVREHGSALEQNHARELDLARMRENQFEQQSRETSEARARHDAARVPEAERLAVATRTTRSAQSLGFGLGALSVMLLVAGFVSFFAGEPPFWFPAWLMAAFAGVAAVVNLAVLPTRVKEMNDLRQRLCTYDSVSHPDPVRGPAHDSQKRERALSELMRAKDAVPRVVPWQSAGAPNLNPGTSSQSSGATPRFPGIFPYDGR
ncbi:hypothetical protein [Microbacterium sp. PMB16]|uniref:hypothetical protein n=1 Tax=Microbacterium sp. PMB16 TaxID=3120157 RepID=UPI003F4B27BA